MAPRNRSVTSSHTDATASSTMTPLAHGSGARMSVAASASPPAWASSSPVGLLRW